VQRWRQRIFYLLLAYSVATVLWASRPWTDTQALVTPPEAGETLYDFSCPSVFSGAAGDPEARDPLPYPPTEKPCGEQTSHRVLFVVDLAAAGVGMALLQRASARYRAAARAADVHDAEIAASA
jgi:hypothetical protein